MVAPISSLANMEMALYGGFGMNANAPSYLNGYLGGSNYSAYNSPSFYGNSYGYGSPYGSASAYNPTFGQNVPYGYGSTAQTTQGTDSVFGSLSQAEKNALTKDFSKSLEAPAESFGSALLHGGLMFGLMNNPRILFHPINTFRATFLGDHATNKLFTDLLADANSVKYKEFQKLWNSSQYSELIHEAWLQHNKAVARCNRKLGAIRQSYKAMGVVPQIEKEIKALEEALKAGNVAKIEEYTARLKHAYSANGGWLANGVNWCRRGIASIIPDSWTTVKGAVTPKNLTVLGNLGTEGAEALKGVETAIKATSKPGAVTFMDMLKRHGGGKMGAAMWAGFEFIADWGKLQTAFDQDTETGMKQLGQTTVKGVANAAGWMLGEAAGKLAFAKWGARLGRIHPMLGVIVGGLSGVVSGSIGMWGASKGAKAIIGKDVADDVQAQKLAQSSEGQMQLLQNTMQRIQSGEQVSPEAQMAVQKLIAQYA